ncbi:MAG: radical SAM protein [Bacteroidales bacterium]|nr:radical SAM protein [Bacteroidales bacterium]
MKVNEIFYSLQGEGYHTGTAATFVRLSGCNLHCPFCDTQHAEGTEMSDAEIVAAVRENPSRLVVITGGEPSLQLTKSLVNALHDADKMVAVETNGTHRLPGNVDWITLSPKDAFLGGEAEVVLRYVDEIKVIFDGVHSPRIYDGIMCTHARFLQPLDTGDPVRNAEIVKSAIEYIGRDPRWRLSLQIHKMLNIR